MLWNARLSVPVVPNSDWPKLIETTFKFGTVCRSVASWVSAATASMSSSAGTS